MFDLNQKFCVSGLYAFKKTVQEICILALR